MATASSGPTSCLQDEVVGMTVVGLGQETYDGSPWTKVSLAGSPSCPSDPKAEKEPHLLSAGECHVLNRRC